MVHISHETLQKFVAGQLAEDEANAVLLHLADNEEALAYVDSLWEKQLGLTRTVTPSLDISTAGRIERRLIRRIRQSDFAGTIIRFGIIGFGTVARAMLMPVAQKIYNPHLEDKRYD